MLLSCARFKTESDYAEDVELASVHRDAPWRGDKTVQYASGAARLRRLELRQVGLGSHTWDKLPAWVIDREPQGYPPGIDGVLALGCQRVRFDFEKSELGWSR